MSRKRTFAISMAVAGSLVAMSMDLATVTGQQTGDAAPVASNFSALTTSETALRTPANPFATDGYEVPQIEAEVLPAIETPLYADADRAGESGQDAADDEVESAMDKMSGPAAALANAGGSGLVELVVSYETHPELFEADRVESLGGFVVRDYNVLDMMAIQVPADALVDFAIEDNVDRISLDNEISAMSVASRQAANLPNFTSGNSAYNGFSRQD